MTTHVTLERIGDSLGVTFPKEIAEALAVGPGDQLAVVRTEQGILLTPIDPALEEGMRVFEEVRAEYDNALRDLASK